LENAAAKMWLLGLVANAPNIGLDHVVINFYPTVSIISRAVDAASSADKVSSYENVTIRIDPTPAHKTRSLVFRV
jgi:hypothetical protein